MLLVSRRKEGEVYVDYILDGQHRVVAMLRLEGWKDQMVPCEVFENLSIEQEAALFLLRQERTKPRTMEVFMRRVLAGEPGPVEINRIVESAGVHLHEQQADGHVTAAAAVERVYVGRGIVTSGSNPKAVADMLGILIAAFGRTAEAMRGELIHGLGLVMLREGSKVNKTEMVERLSLFPGGATHLIGMASGNASGHGTSKSIGMAGTIVDLYNKGRRNPKTHLRSWWSK